MRKSHLLFYTILFPLYILGQSNTYYEHGYKIEEYGLAEGIEGPEVSDIIEDKNGYIWLASLNALIRYDGVTFKNYPLSKEVRINGVRDLLWQLYEDNDGNIWTTSQGGRDLIKFNPTTEKFCRFSFDTETKPQIVQFSSNEYLIAFENKLYQAFFSDTVQLKKIDLNSLGINQIWKIVVNGDIKLLRDKKGTIWFSYLDNFGKLSVKKDKLNFLPLVNYKITSDSILWNKLWNIHDGYKDNLWLLRTRVSNKTNNNSIIYLTRVHKRTGIFEDFELKLSPEQIGQLKVYDDTEYFDINEDKQGNLWLSIFGHGIVRINSSQLKAINNDTFSVTIFSPFGNTWATYLDSWDNLWIGTQLNYLKKIKLQPSSFEFINLQQDPSIQDCEFNNILEDDRGNIWMEFNNEDNTKRGLLKYNLTTLQLETYADHFKGINIKNERFTPVMKLNNSNILFSKNRTLHEYSPFLDKIIRSSPKIDSPSSFIEKSTVFQNGFHYNDSLIVVQLHNNAYLLNKDTWELKYHFHGNIFPVTVAKSRKEGFWFANPSGTNFLKWNGNKMDTLYPKNIGKMPITSAIEDSKGNLWLTGATGVSLFAPKDTTGKMFTKNDALLLERFSGMEEDNQQNIWFFTPQGPCRFNPITQKIETFSGLKEIKAKLTFGGIRQNIKNKDGVFRVLSEGGFYSFHPDNIHKDTLTPNIIFKTIIPNIPDDEFEKKMAISNKFIVNTFNYTFPFAQNSITIEYIGVHLHNPKEVTYAYQLEGLNNDWQKVGKERIARFLNLPAGEYIFKVKAANADGVWGTAKSINITILPPWYWSWWSKTLYVLLIGGLIYAFYRFQLNRQLAEAETTRLAELDAVKTKMYTNITHEFRTPLSVILGSAEQLEGQLLAKETIQRNSLNLLNLVNQMLDLSRLEAGNLPIKMQQGDVINYLKYLIESFHSFADSKSIRLHFLTEIAAYEMDFDPDKLMKIVTNLFSNAIKFTEEGGNIYMQITIQKNNKAIKTSEVLHLQIKDTGIGIAPENLPHIFDRFYQINDETTREGEGTGIGLAFTKELVKLLQGEIEVSSEIGKGSTFSVWLPVSKVANPLANNAFEYFIKDYFSGSTNTELLEENTISSKTTEQPLILVVEDNSDVRKYLEQCLKKEYQLVFARNGMQGIEKAIELTPDIIISDVMMPQKDGFELCDTLKRDVRTSHIPIVLLTAKVDIDSRITGIGKGADAYFAKPFNRQELNVQLTQLLKSREQLKAYYTQTILETSPQPTLPDDNLENVFLQKIVHLIEEDLQTEWDIDKLCKALAMSRSQIYRKIKALTGYSTTIFIRRIRLKNALKMLATTDKNISEIAYATGFNNLSFFSKSFSEVYQKTPSQYREGL